MKSADEIRKESSGKRLWRLFYPALTYLGICYVVEIVYACVIAFRAIANGQVVAGQELQLVQQLAAEALSDAFLLQMLGAAISLPILYLYYRGDRKREELLGTDTCYSSVPIYLYAGAAILGIFTCLAGNNLILGSGLSEISGTYDEISEVLYSGGLVVELLGLGILIPIVEELIFRGLIYRRLREKLPISVSAVMVSLMFAFFHGNLLQGIYAFLLSLLLVYVYERYHHFAAPAIFHIAANVISVIATETGIIDWTYRTRGVFWGATILYCIGIVLCVVFIEYMVVSEEIPKPEMNEAFLPEEVIEQAPEDTKEKEEE